MRVLRSILLATDFRPASRAADAAAAGLARAFGSRVTLFHAIESQPNWPADVQAPEKEGLLREQAEALAARGVTVAGSSAAAGSAAAAILDRAEQVDADLIVIGAGDRTGQFRFAGGPTAQAVLEHAAQPVLAVRPGEPALTFRKILCPVDQSGPAAQGLRHAARLARALGGELLVLTVVPEVSWLTAATETGKFTDARAEYEAKWRGEFDRFLADVPTEGAAARVEVRHGPPHEQIAAAARDHGADLIVLGATGRTGLVRVLLGSTTRRVLEALPCSLLAVKQEDAFEELFEGEVRLINRLTAEGRSLAAAGAHEEALGRFRQALAHNPFHGPALEGAAAAQEGLGRHEQARNYRRRIESLRPVV